MTETDRPQPHDDNAERALLGAMLLSAHAAAEADALLTAADFHHPIHAGIYIAVLARTSRNRPVDPIIVAQDLTKAGTLAKLPGGAAYLHTCLQACPDPSHATYYAHIVAQHAQARRLLALSEDLVKAAMVEDPNRRTQLLALTQTALARIGATTRINNHHIRLTPASTFQIKAVRWMWEGRMPLGEITLVPGREGVGKSTFLAWLAATITNGNLPGIYHGQPRAVLYAASEDAWSYTIAPRMLAAGANLDLVYRIDVEEDDGSAHGLILPRDCRHLPTIAADVNAAALMCDPVLSLVDTTINSFKGQELRTALEPLRRAAEEAHLAIPALVHFNKGAGGDVGTLIAGARTWSEVARAVVAIAQDKEADDYTCVVSQTKNNLGRLDLPNLVYTIDSVMLETDDEPAQVGRLRWVGESDVSAEDLLTGDPADRTLSDNTLAIIDFVDGAANEVSVQDVTDYFKDRIKYDTVKKTLARCAKRGDLVSLSRGMYKTARKGNQQRNTPRITPPIYPPVPMSLVSPPLVNGGIGVSPGDTGGVPRSDGDTRDRDTGDARARAREGIQDRSEPDEDEPEREWYP